MAGYVTRAIQVVLFAFIGLLTLVYIWQRRLQYFPDPTPVRLPQGTTYERLRDVALTTSDGVHLQAWYWPGDESVTLLIFHGNAGNRADRLSWMAGFHDRGYGVFMLDYRGYGGSLGRPSETGFYADAAAAWKWLREETTDGIVVLGESIGSGVAVELCQQETPAALVIQSGFTSAVDVGRQAYPFLPVQWFLKDRYDNASKLSVVQAPLLVIHGDQDQIIPASHGQMLFEIGNFPKQLYLIEGAGHNDLVLVAQDEYYDRIEAFLKNATSVSTRQTE